MKKTSLLLSLGALLLTSCSPLPTSAEGDVSLWGCSNSLKVRSDIEYASSYRSNSLSVMMAKNESEGAQVVLSPTSELSDVQISISDLTSSTSTIKSDSVSFFWEYYVTTVVSSNNVYKPGSYPDALIPFSAVVKKGENKVKAGANQAIYVKFFTDKNTLAGTYQGTISVSGSSFSSTLPVSLKVFDFAISDEVHTKSSFLIYPQGLLAGEYDSSPAMYKKYYDFLLDYRISAMDLPSTLSPDSLVSAVREYYDNPKVSCYNLPYIGAMSGIDYDILRRDIKALVGASVKDGKNYLSKAYVYNLYNDEYAYKSEDSQQAAKRWIIAFNAMKQELVDFYDGGFGSSYLDSVSGLRFSLANLIDLSVTNYVEGVSNLDNCICSSLDMFASSENRAKLSSMFKGAGKELWWYGCVNPKYPYPTYHLDDNPLSPRLLSWMQYDYKIDGNLYFMVNMHYGDGGTYLAQPIDEWNLSDHYLSSSGVGINGDGWLLYPGKNYGIDGPIGSLRLEEIKDGLEDYECLYHLNSLLQDLGTKYGQSGLDASTSLKGSFESICTGMFPTTNTLTFEKARTALFDTIDLAKNAIVISSRKDTSSAIAVTMLLPKKATISNLLPRVSIVKKEDLNEECQQVSFSVALSDTEDAYLGFDYTIDGVTTSFSSFLAKAVHHLLDCASLSATDLASYFRISTGETPMSATVDSTGAAFFNPSVMGDGSRPYIVLKSKFTALLNDEMTALNFYLYNGDDTEKQISISHLLGSIETTDLTMVLPSKSWTTVSVPLSGASAYGWFRLYVPILSTSQKIYLSKVDYSL